MSDSPIYNGPRLSPLGSQENLLINGDFKVWQRHFSFSGIGFFADRWYSRLENCLYERQEDPEYGYYARATKITNPGAITPRQAIELPGDGITIAGLQAGSDVTISGVIRLPDGPNFSTAQVRLRWIDDSADTNPLDTFPFTDIEPSGGWLTNQWQYFEVTGTLLASVVDQKALGLTIRFQDMPTDERIDFAQMKVEPGPRATAFEYEPFGVTLAKCQRYYQRPLQNYGFEYPSPSTALMQRMRNFGNTGVVRMTQALTTTMRVNPTVNARQDIDDGTIVDANVEYTRQNLFGLQATINAGSVWDLNDWQADAEF